MLTRMLLHVIAPAPPIDLAAHGGSGIERLGRCMPDFSVPVFFDVEDRRAQRRAAGGGRLQNAGIMRLTAAGRIKCRSVQGYLPQALSLTPGNFPDVGNPRLEGGEKGFRVVEPLGHNLKPFYWELSSMGGFGCLAVQEIQPGKGAVPAWPNALAISLWTCSIVQFRGSSRLPRPACFAAGCWRLKL